jgi:uncharacterized membrane protein
VTLGTRDLSVDVARGLALLSMFVAHTAPSDGPANVLELSEFLTAPLFATLIGMGLSLGWRRFQAAAEGGYGRFLAGVAVRSVALVVIGLLLERLSTDVVFVQVIIILVQLGVLILVAAPLVRLPSSVVAAVGVVFVVLGSVLGSVLSRRPILYSGFAEGHLGHLNPARALDIVAFGPYRLTYLLAWACLGIVLARRSQLTNGFLGSRFGEGMEGRTTWQLIRGDSLVTAGALILCGALLVARSAGAITMVAYQRNVPEVAFDALLCTAVVCGSAVLVRLLPRPTIRPVAVAGAMTLTLYVAQVLVLAAFTAPQPATWSDDSWRMLIGLIIGSLAFAMIWHAVVRTGVFARGPLEGVVGLGVRAVQKPVARPRARKTAV